MLLKNEGQVLPLKKGSSVAVLGPHSDGHDVFLSSKHQEPFVVGTLLRPKEKALSKRT